MEAELAQDPSLLEHVEGISTTVWVAMGLLAAAILWLLKWAVTVLFVQGKGVSLVTIPFSRVAGKILEDRFVQKLADTKTLPKLHVPASWQEFNRFNGYVAHRMQTYRELIHLVQTKFNGPSAVCLRIAVRYFEQEFVETFRTAERGFRELDRLDDKVRATHRSIHDELKTNTDPLERERIAAEKDHEMIRIRRKHAIAAQPVSLWLRRRLGQFLGSLVAPVVNLAWSSLGARELKREKRKLRARLYELRTAIAEEHRRIFSEHEAEVAGVCLELIEHDRMFLSHLYHRFGLEVESLKFTVASGRVLELVAADNEAGARARRELGLDGSGCGETLICDAEALREQVRLDPELQTYVGLGPEAVLEGTFEAYLRIKLLLGTITLPGYSPHWIAHLPPPGEFGRAQLEYQHFAHQLGWLKRPLPGMEVHTNGLVSLGELPEGEPATAPEIGPGSDPGTGPEAGPETGPAQIAPAG
ncbi:hypothetical protein LNKW23_08010 [Paralimibaculum aggregatum]|uniref:Uncharacterized protein n=1 Tax=Paralimibaculum aggregatum TaxID=3036245 RepID=A0ABQ6LE10_9RHOB|nr:hypothetical protein [Limibaculum sp. NKW23]GMG81588.1 hypothetical protein LNKW23_08010 [Limibaculum sp. NKW23]